MSRFFCDTNCELWYEEFDKLNIDLIQMPYTVDGVEKLYDLGRNTDIKKFFDLMRKGAKAKTQALNQYDYNEYFEPILKSGEDILYVTFSHKMSATFEAMRAAIQELKVKYPERKISVVDTKSICIGAGIVVYNAALLHNSGASDEEVIRFVESFRERVKVFFTVSDLVYLKRGGRLTGFKAIMGTILNLKPIIEIEDGSLVSKEKAQGRKMAIKKLVSYIDKFGIDSNYPLYLINADCESDSNFTKDQILLKYPDITIRSQLVGPVIGSHCGPDTVGIVFIKKED